MKVLIILILPVSLIAGFQELDHKDLYRYESSQKKVLKRKIKRKRKPNQLDTLTKKLLEQDHNINLILENQKKTLIVKRSSETIPTLTRVKGVVLNSILAMNIRPSTFIVRIQDDDEFLNGSELLCVGHSFQKRVPARCSLLVSDGKEYQVKVDIWDLDGADGIIADYFYSGEEKAFITSSFASFLEGVLDVAKDRITTPFGEVTRNNAKNRVLSGMTSIGENARKRILESGEKNLTISYVNSGKEVLVFFNKSLKI